MASESSAKAGSNAFSGNGASCSPAPRADSRKDDRDEGRSGVVGRDVREREFERLPGSRGVVDILATCMLYFAFAVLFLCIISCIRGSAYWVMQSAYLISRPEVELYESQQTLDGSLLWRPRNSFQDVAPSPCGFPHDVSIVQIASHVLYIMPDFDISWSRVLHTFVLST